MKNQKTHTVQQLVDYLKNVSYELTYRQGIYDAYCNPRNRQYILIPFTLTRVLTREDIIELFEESKAIDMPPELEYNRFTIYIHSMSNR